MKKLIVISAPSGAGKTSIVNYLIREIKSLSFSISACSRPKRPAEKDGIEYNFFSVKEFRKMINNNAFVEWEEVYKDQYYGTLKTELERIWTEGKTVIFDLDVMGALNIKNQYLENCLSIFVMPPSIKELEKRLTSRGTETKQSLNKRLAKAELEISKSIHFDQLVINDNLEECCKETETLVKKFINT